MRKSKKTISQIRSEEYGKAIFWGIVQRNNAEDEYRRAVRRYCLTCENWDEVQKLRDKAHYYGVNDERLLEIDIEVQSSITDEEILEAIGE